MLAKDQIAEEFAIVSEVNHCSQERYPYFVFNKIMLLFGGFFSYQNQIVAQYKH